jgi:WD40-like Beta Propeller Repeat
MHTRSHGGRWRWLPLALATAVIAAPADLASARSGSIVFRCGPNLCRVAPDGSGRTQLTTNGRRGGPTHGWLSATGTGSRLGVAFGNKAYILNGSGRRVRGPFQSSGAVLMAHIRPDGRRLATIEQVAELLRPGAPTLTPYLFLARASGAGRATVARSTATTGWLGRRLMRDDRAPTDPFEQGICLLASNTSFECARSVAVDARHDLWGPVASPNGRLIAATRAPLKRFAGEIAIYNSATGARVRSVTSGTRDSQPSWSPNGKRIVFTRRRSLYVVSATGGRARRIAAGIQPIWVSGD